MRRIKNKSLRPILTEFTPYEHPLALDARNIYYFLEYINFEFLDDHTFIVSKRKLQKNNNRFILSSIFEHSQLELVENNFMKDNKIWYKYVFNKNSGISPYNYLVHTGPGKYRTISLMHPVSMIQATKFLHENRNSIIYFCSKSNFSIRKPVKVASRYSVPSLLDKKLENSKYGIINANVELTKDLTKNIRSYFTYDKFNLIYKFYDSKEFENSGLTYSYISKLDIAKCFPSIYTHSVSWATNGWQTSKRKFSDSTRKEDLRDTFGNRFDSIMQCINHRETNGVIVGPEFSRIFAEIILQKVDTNVERSLREKKLIHNVDYKIYRYVDDYFVFANSKSNLQLINEVIARYLEIYKFHLNEDKQKLLKLPQNDIYSYIKRDVRENISNSFEISFEKNLTIEFKSQKFNNRLKELLQNNLEYDSYSTIGYTYALLIKKLSRATSLVDEKHKSVKLNYNDLKNISLFFEGIIESSFYLFRTSPTYSNSIKLITIIFEIAEWSSNRDFYPLLMWSHLRDRIIQNFEICLLTLSGVNSLPLHLLNILETLLYLNYPFTEDLLYSLLEKCHVEISELSCNEILILYKIAVHCNLQNIKKELDRRIIFILDNSKDPKYMTQSTLIKIAFGFDPRQNREKPIKIRSRNTPGIAIFEWEPQKYFGLSLAYKHSSVVY